MKQLFGSSLIKKYYPEFREPKDTDYLVDDINNYPASTKEVEYYHIPMLPTHRELTPDEIYTLKVSHSIRDIHWSKTIGDIRFLQRKECVLIPSLLEELREHWNQVHGIQKRTDFNVGLNSFFVDNVKRVIPHDELHIELNTTPSYLEFVDNDLKPNKDKFFSLTEKKQFDIVFEEAFVIALERFSYEPPRLSYHKAQQILVTRLIEEWLADFTVMNWNKCFWNASNSSSYQQFLNLREKYYAKKK